jgi:hypothetical protein
MLSEQNVLPNLFFFSCVEQLEDCRMYIRSNRMYQDYSGMYRNVSEQELEEEECTTREDVNGKGEKFWVIKIIVSGINILNVVVALIVELLEDLYCIYYIYVVGNNCRRGSN